MSFLRIPRSLGGRLTFSFVGLIVITMVVLAAVVPGIAREYQLTALEDRLTDQAQLVANQVASELGHQPETSLDALAKRLGQNTDTRITIIALDGTVIGESHQELSQAENHANRPEVRQALATGRGIDSQYSSTVGYEMLYVAVPVRQDGRVIGTVRTALPLSQVNRLVDNLTRAIVFSALLGSAIATGVAFLAGRAITVPLARLNRQAEKLAEDPLHKSYFRRGEGPSEVAQLSETLDRMATAVRDSLGQLGAERDRLDAVLANLADGVVMIDGSGHVALLNAAAQRLLGVEGQAATGHTVAEVLRDHELIELVEQARANSEQPRVETRVLELRNPRRLLRAAVTRFDFGDLSELLLVLHDLTETQRLETVRRDFVANVSHELRTPIASIKVMTETLLSGAVDDPDASRDFLVRIEQEVDGVHRLVEELLELSRLESGRVGVVLLPTDPAELVANGVRRLAAMAERAKVSLSAEIPTTLPLVLADADRMGQVLVNLIHNAVKFTPPHGRITVSAAAEGDWVKLSVSDSGVGITRELLPRIFERFYKADPARAGGGTGLGLAIAKHTVQLHGGQIWAESDGPGRGTTIHLSLPTVTTN